MHNLLTRRQFALSAAAAFVGAVAPRISFADDAPPPPTVDTTNLKEIADGVWVVRDHRIWLVPNIGIVLGKDAALIIDTGLGPANGERVLKLAHEIAGNRRLMLTITHFHPEHGYGAQILRPEATIIYNRAQRDELSEKGQRFLDLFRQRQRQSAVDALEGTQIVMPHFVYDGPTSEIDLGGRRVLLQNWGMAHTRGDHVVFLPEERILFAGDLIEERMFPIFPWIPPTEVDIDAVRWVNILNDFQRFGASTIVPGHGDPGDISIALNLASYIETVGRHVSELRKAGRSGEEILAEYKPQIISGFPDWDNRQMIDGEIKFFAARS